MKADISKHNSNCFVVDAIIVSRPY